MVGRALNLEMWDLIHGVRYATGLPDGTRSQVQFIRCDCGEYIEVELSCSDDQRVIRRSEATCPRCGTRFEGGSEGPGGRTRTALWADAPEVE